MRFQIRLRMFLSSYAPLFGLLALRFDRRVLWITCASLAGVGLLAGISVLRGIAKRTGVPRRVTAIEDRGAEVAGYLATYILPFVTVPEPRVKDVIAYAGFLSISAIVHVRSQMMQINPVLYLFGRRVLDVTTEQGWRGYVIVGNAAALQVGDTLHGVRLDDDLLVARRIDRNTTQ